MKNQSCRKKNNEELPSFDELNRTKFYNLMNSYNVPYFSFVRDFKNNKSLGNMFFDYVHYTPKGNKYIAQRIFDVLFTVLSGKAIEFANKYRQISKEYMSEYENQLLASYVDNLKAFSAGKSENSGEIVINYNQFTNGHRYLIETAVKMVDQFYVFVLEQDSDDSIFDFKTRKELVIRA
jgi:[citrate (pro-3S)-lyase] ligase